MFMRLLKTTPMVVLAVATAAWATGGGSTAAYAQCGCGQRGGGHAGHDAGPAGHEHAASHGDHAGHEQPADRDQPAPPHGGQLTIAPPMAFEVVYLPREIRVYLYGPGLQPETARDVPGEVALQRPNDERVTRIGLHYVARPAGQQDFLVAPVDLTRAQDGDLTATVRLANLPLENRPGITFSQAVVLANTRPQVVLAVIGPGDQAGIAGQRVCPVTGAPLDSMGGPIKVLVGGQPLYLCCKGCLGKVQNAPEAYLHKTGQGSKG